MKGEIRDHSDSVIAGNILLLSGVFGFLLGAFPYGTWQLAAETAQMIAGNVQYSNNNLFYWYHTKAWTLLHQIFVPLLWMGLSEKSLSFFLSGLIGMLSFQALSFSVWVISKDAAVALGMPFLVLFTYATRFFNVYPVFVLSTPNTHGAIGMSLFLLTIALLSSDKTKAGLFLLGIFPAVHFSIAVLCWAVVSLNYLLSPSEIQNELRMNAKYLLMGIGVSTLSLLIQFLWIYDVPNIQSSATRTYFETFIQVWDSHRKPLSWDLPVVYLNAAACAISLLWTTFFRNHLKDKSEFIIRSFGIAGMLGFATVFISRLSPEKLPEFYLMLMPGRILEFNTFGFVAMVAGLCAMFGRNILARLIVAIFVFLAAWKGQLSLPVIFVFGALPFLLPSFIKERTSAGSTRIPAIALRGVTLSCFIFMAFITIIRSDRFHYDFRDWNLYNLSDRSNDPFFESLSHRKGLLLTGGDLHLIQLRSRRPVLLDGGQLDMLPYAPEIGPQMASIVQDVYGINFFSPPKEAFRMASIPTQPVKSIWESKTMKDWQTIRGKYGVSEVLTSADWKLHLPVISRNTNFVAYSIPN